MKAVKYVAALCVVIFLTNIALPNAFGQETDKPIKKGMVEESQDLKVKVENKEVPESIVSSDLNANKNIYSKRKDERYRIGFQDTLSITVQRHDELSQTVSVNPDGTINLYRVDNPVVAVCKTEKQLQDLIAELYLSFLKKPFVTVRAIEQRSQPIAVIGAVEKPGSYYLNNRVRLIQILSYAGGYDVEKAGSKIQIARLGNLAGCVEEEQQPKDSEVEFLSYDLFELLKGNQNPWVQPGDIISVLEAEEAYVVGNVVNESEKISLKEPVTLTQAIAKAGGIAKNANTSQIRIQRQKAGSPVRTQLVFDLKKIANNETPDPVLQGNDIVEVPTDGFKSFKSNLIKTLTNGIPSILYRFP